MIAREETAAWWLTPLSQVGSGVGVGGLSQREARRRRKIHGANEFVACSRSPLVLEFLKRFRNPLVLVLLGASLVSALTGDVQSFVIIAVMVLLSVSIDFVQEYRADRTAERLRQSVMVRASVLRNGVKRLLPVAQIVPGDICLLAAGDLVPADGRLIEARDLFVNQALLTGEPYPVEKNAGDLAAGSEELANASNALFMGTSVVSGTATLLVHQTGRATAMGEIADTLTAAPPPTAFEMGTRRFGMLIMRLTVFLVLFVLFVNTLAMKPLLESFLFAIALAVGLTPELLPMVVSMTLARGAQCMAKSKVVVKRLAGAALFLPFLPMLPTQILLNNILYDLSEVPIPLDRVDPEEIRLPQKWDMTFIRNYMWVIGPVSSLFDFLTFYVLLAVLHADQALFQTGWFIESLATQVLVIFIIRSRGNPWTNRPAIALVVTSLAVVAVAVLLPATPVGARFGFVVPPVEFFWILAALVIAYLVLVQLVKRAFYRYLARGA